MASLLVTCPKCNYKTLSTHKECIHCEASLGDLAEPAQWMRESDDSERPAPSPPVRAEPPLPSPETKEPETPPEAEKQEWKTPPGHSRSRTLKSTPADASWPPRTKSSARGRIRRRAAETQDTQEIPESKTHLRGKCPRGHGALTPARLLARDVMYCHSCKGLWIAPDVFQQFLRRQAEQMLASGPPKGGDRLPIPRTSGISTPASCPSCTSTMERRVYGDFSGILIDICPKHGIWLDDRELKAIMRYIPQAGMDFARSIVEEAS